MSDQHDIDENMAYVKQIESELYPNKKIPTEKKFKELLNDKLTMVEKHISNDNEVVVKNGKYMNGDRRKDGKNKWKPLICSAIIKKCLNDFLTSLNDNKANMEPKEILEQVSNIYALKLLAEKITSDDQADQEFALSYIMPYTQKKPSSGLDLNMNKGESPLIEPLFNRQPDGAITT